MLLYTGLAMLVGAVIYLLRVAGRIANQIAWERYYASKSKHVIGEIKSGGFGRSA